MTTFTIVPKVDETQEFLEIANDFSNPLELVREAISNAFDANAKNIRIEFAVQSEHGERMLLIRLQDDGDGMDEAGLRSFFDLGNSLRRNDDSKIGEKGHGTKVYFNSGSIEVTTRRNTCRYKAVMQAPFRTLHERQIPTVAVQQEVVDGGGSGTEILIRGYNNNRRELFTHARLRDYAQWFTKIGSIGPAVGSDSHVNVKLHLKGLDQQTFEEIPFGHSFPPDSPPIQKLFDQHLVRAPDYYCKQIVKKGKLRNFPEISYEAIFCVEGNIVKQTHNPMLRRQGYSAPAGAYTVQERYGLWLCKDHIPIQRKNEWITFRGSEYTRLHAFFNCQAFRLTANRGSVDNTPSEIMADVRDAAVAIFREIAEGDAWREIEWLESESVSYRTVEKEKKDFDWRVKKANKANVAEFKGHLLVEPQRESGVFALFVQLSTIDPSLFPFAIVDYDTHSGIDVIVKGDRTTPLQSARLFYVEFKMTLGADFNHSFQNLQSIVCWDTDIKHDETTKDLCGEERKMQIVTANSQTKYFLDNPQRAHKIEVIVLKDFLREKLGLEFRPRSATATV